MYLWRKAARLAAVDLLGLTYKKGKGKKRGEDWPKRKNEKPFQLKKKETGSLHRKGRQGKGGKI